MRPGVRRRRAGRLPRGAQPRAARARHRARCAGCRSGSRGPPLRRRPSRRRGTCSGFKDGTDNLLADDASEFDRFVWVGEETDQPWLRGGSYLVARRIRTRLEAWAATSLDAQEATIGRFKSSGAPLTGHHEHDKVDLAARGPRGVPVIPRRRAHPSRGAVEQRRREDPASRLQLRRRRRRADRRARRRAVLRLLPEGPAPTVRPHPVGPRDQRHAARRTSCTRPARCSPARPASLPVVTSEKVCFAPPERRAARGARRAAIASPPDRRGPCPSTRGLACNVRLDSAARLARPRRWCSSAAPWARRPWPRRRPR